MDIEAEDFEGYNDGNANTDVGGHDVMKNLVPALQKEVQLFIELAIKDRRRMEQEESTAGVVKDLEKKIGEEKRRVKQASVYGGAQRAPRGPSQPTARWSQQSRIVRAAKGNLQTKIVRYIDAVQTAYQQTTGEPQSLEQAQEPGAEPERMSEEMELEPRSLYGQPEQPQPTPLGQPQAPPAQLPPTGPGKRGAPYAEQEFNKKYGYGGEQPEQPPAEPAQAAEALDQEAKILEYQAQMLEQDIPKGDDREDFKKQWLDNWRAWYAWEDWFDDQFGKNTIQRDPQTLPQQRPGRPGRWHNTPPEQEIEPTVEREPEPEPPGDPREEMKRIDEEMNELLETGHSRSGRNEHQLRLAHNKLRSQLSAEPAPQPAPEEEKPWEPPTLTDIKTPRLARGVPTQWPYEAYDTEPERQPLPKKPTFTPNKAKGPPGMWLQDWPEPEPETPEAIQEKFKQKLDKYYKPSYVGAESDDEDETPDWDPKEVLENTVSGINAYMRDPREELRTYIGETYNILQKSYPEYAAWLKRRFKGTDGARLLK